MAKPKLRSHTDKIKSAKALYRALADEKKSAKKNGNETVFTNGCFDLLHKGHVTYLERARQLGARLVVALNADHSVRKLKGIGRPINTLADRMDVIAALESVDYVTWFDESTPLKLVLLLKPDVIVKGGDWTEDDIVGGREVISWGGEVKTLPYIEGKSTTEIIEKARKNHGL